MPPGDAFEVEPAALRELAAVFEREADRLADAVPAFRDTSYGVNDAFGMLGPSQDALEAFLDVAHRDSAELEKAARALAATAAGLRQTARNYAGAEADSRVPGVGGHR